MRILSYLDRMASLALQKAMQCELPPPAIVRPASSPKHGDYQVNGVMPLAKAQGQQPRELAGRVVPHLIDDPAIAAAEVAGPGFINLRLDPQWCYQQLHAMLAQPQRLGVPQVETSEPIVLDYSSPNIAKHMHVGHLRSTILGDALARVLDFIGHRITRDNHLGDWGTQYGLLILGMQHFGSQEALQQRPMDELERVYQQASARAKEDSDFATQARQELAQLHAGSAAHREQWERMVQATRASLEQIYARLGICFDTWRGESSYHDALPETVSDLCAQGLAREDQGAVGVFFSELEHAPAELKRVDTPFLIRKGDGAFLYATTDIATAHYRHQELKAQRCIYVVDVRQSLHFKQLFALLKLQALPMQLDHVGFGTILGADNKPLRTRDGGTVRLAALLDEAEERAQARIHEQGLQIDASALEQAARAIGIGAIKYADLRQNRLSDYRFDWDKLLSFQGNSGPYLQYAYARIQSIFRKGDIKVDELKTVSQPWTLHEASEQALARQLLNFPDVVYSVADSLEPHRLSDHLYALARSFSAFYEACPILNAEPATRTQRLQLAYLSALQLKQGLHLLGIDVVERM